MVREESAKKKGRALIQGSEEGHFHHEAFLAHFQGRAWCWKVGLYDYFQVRAGSSGSISPGC